MKRPIATIVLAALSLAAAVSSLVVALQLLGVISWGEERLDFWGGKWTGVPLFGLEAAIALLVAYGWLTLKPWAFTITLLMALTGLFIPLSSLAAGTETWSTALLPILVNGAVVAMVLSPDVRRVTSPSPMFDSILLALDHAGRVAPPLVQSSIMNPRNQLDVLTGICFFWTMLLSTHV